MDYVFGVMPAGSKKLTVGIWPEIEYVHGAAATIMEQCATEALVNMSIQEAMSIMHMAASLDQDVNQKIFDDMETSADVVRFETDHFMFAFMTMNSLKVLMEEEDSPINIGEGADHRKCPYVKECTKTPTAEQLENGWVPWETEEAKS